jgi:hypothetical protein
MLRRLPAAAAVAAIAMFLIPQSAVADKPGFACPPGFDRAGARRNCERGTRGHSSGSLPQGLGICLVEAAYLHARGPADVLERPHSLVWAPSPLGERRASSQWKRLAYRSLIRSARVPGVFACP